MGRLPYKIPGTSGVYELIDPRDGRVRYVGFSRNVEARFIKHLWSGIARGAPVRVWLGELRRNKILPLCRIVVSEKPEHVLLAAERELILSYFLVGEADLNVRRTWQVGADGGVLESRATTVKLEDESAKGRAENALLRAAKSAESLVFTGS